jgi:uncharacterized protein YdhG (YjbR/CyaY superfamily)
MTDPTTATAQVDAMLAALPEAQREVLEALRRTIAATAPDAVDTTSYGMPAFRYHGRALVAYAGFKAHCSLFPMSAELIERLQVELGEFVAAKGTLRFTPAHPIPVELVQRIVRERMAQIDSR